MHVFLKFSCMPFLICNVPLPPSPPPPLPQAPLLVISGGPGLPSSYMEPLELMAGVGRQVIFYDQVSP